MRSGVDVTLALASRDKLRVVAVHDSMPRYILYVTTETLDWSGSVVLTPDEARVVSEALANAETPTH